jgi:predicted sulfurtransferase
MGKIILYYLYTPIENPESIAQEQRDLCEKLCLRGRILIAHEGINGTVGGSDESVASYKIFMQSHPVFSGMDLKESEGESDHFPRLQVKVKKEIVNFGYTAIHETPGTYLSPEEAHQLMLEAPENLIIFDARNGYESRVGAFDNAHTPEINHFRELPSYIDEHLDTLKDKKVLMYCTGGIRCEKATAYVKMKQVAKEVYHIKGGIHRYIEAFPDGLFKGKNYVFDGRVTQRVSEDILAHCEQCAKPYDDYNNCINAECNKQIIVCPDCIDIYHNTCSTTCSELVQARKVNIRTIPHKILIPAEKR